MSDSSEVLYDVKNRIAAITINRPEKRNSISPGVMIGLNQYMDMAEADPEVSVIVLTGADGHFCSGADLGGGSFDKELSFLEMHQSREHYAHFLLKMNRCRKPIIAAIEGYCLAGGMGLCLSSDMVIAHEKAQFGVPEIKRGIWPYMVTAILIRNVGRKKALEFCMTGERISAAEAERIGMINYAVPDAEYSTKVDQMAAKLASYSPAIMGLGKEAFYRVADMNTEDALNYLRSQLTINSMTEDISEGISAFMEKRKPVWKGR